MLGLEQNHLQGPRNSPVPASPNPSPDGSAWLSHCSRGNDAIIIPGKCQFPFPSLHFQSWDTPGIDSPGMQRKLLPVQYPIIIGKLSSSVGGLPGYAGTKFIFQRGKNSPQALGFMVGEGCFHPGKTGTGRIGMLWFSHFSSSPLGADIHGYNTNISRIKSCPNYPKSTITVQGMIPLNWEVLDP